jgi:tetratricopeptide (TPR) repeat protein
MILTKTHIAFRHLKIGLIVMLILRGCALNAQSDSVKTLIAEAEKAMNNDQETVSIEKAKNALELANTEGSDLSIGEVLFTLGRIHRAFDKPSKADEYFTKASRVFEKIAKHNRHAQSLAELGRVKQGQRNMAEAIELYTQSLNIYNQKLTPDEAFKLRNLKALILERMAVILSNQKQYDQAETYALEAYNLCEKVGDKGRLEITSTTTGNVYFWLKNNEKAAFYYQKAYELAKDIGRNTGLTLNNLGIIASRSKQYDKAIGYYSDAIEQYKKSSANDMIAQTQINIADIYNEKGDFANAITYAQQGTEHILKNKTITGLMEGYEALITAYIRMGDLPKALENQRKFTTLKDSLFNSSKQKELLELQTKFATEKKDKEIQILNQDKLVAELKLIQQNLDLINQKLLTEKNAKTLDLLRQSKLLQEADLARATSELSIEKQVGENRNTQLSLYQTELKLKQQQAEVQEKNNAILRGLLLTLIIAGLLLWQFLRYRSRVEREREIMEKLRADEAHLRQLQETELRALRSQMNPHFIFNCLNAVKSLVLKNENEAASQYITKFSRLVRMVLENSRNEWISLEEELNILTLYLEIEQTRFNNSFQYWINIEGDVDTNGVKIPPMLIQPYVENAIWHGLMHKEGNGNVTISIQEKEENIIEINVLDDGVGRQKAKALKSKTATKNKSLGMEISTDRLNIINQIYKVNTKVEVQDLVDSQGIACGTNVCLKLVLK